MKKAAQPPSVCAGCGKEGTDYNRCSSCKAVHYCSRTCQRAHWREHKPKCHRPMTTQEMQRAMEADGRVVGAAGEAKAASGKWWPVVITRVHADGCFDVDVQDGEGTKWSRMPPASVRKRV